MEARRLGPVVGLGTWNTFDTDDALALGVVAAAWEAGTRLVDSSPMYRGAEGALGPALAGRRDEAIVATKIWANSVDEGLAQFAHQLELYGGRIDVEQVHNLVHWREHLEWLQVQREAGTIGRLGVTHYQPAAYDELATALRTGRFEVLQVPYNPWERGCEAELLPLAAELGVAVIAMRPLGGSEAGARRSISPPAEVLASLGVETWAHALLRWALSDMRIDAVIPATSRPERAHSNARAADGPIFTDEQRRLVEQLALA